MFGHTPFQFTGQGRAIRLAAEKNAQREPAKKPAEKQYSSKPVTASGQSLTDWAREMKSQR